MSTSPINKPFFTNATIWPKMLSLAGVLFLLASLAALAFFAWMFFSGGLVEGEEYLGVLYLLASACFLLTVPPLIFCISIITDRIICIHGILDSKPGNAVRPYGNQGDHTLKN